MLAQLKQFSVIHLKGANSKDFLQGQLTCDVSEVSLQKSSLAAMCDYKGRMLANFFCWGADEDYYLLLPDSMLDQLMTHLTKYAAFSQVALTRDDDYSALIFTIDADKSISNKCEVDELARVSFDLAGDAGVAKQLFFLMGDKQQVNQVLADLSRCDSQQAGEGVKVDVDEESVALAMMQADLAFITPKTSGLFIPQMLHLQKLGGVSFKKGCYVGQEVIARTEHRGQLKRHLVRLAITNCDTQEGLPEVGDELHNEQDQAVGVVTSVVALANQPHYQLLAVVQDRALEQALFCKRVLLMSLV